jgi:hypothetical protein
MLIMLEFANNIQKTNRSHKLDPGQNSKYLPHNSQPETDNSLLYISRRRTMSSACCAAHWRMRSRSPLKRFSSTSVCFPSETAM